MPPIPALYISSPALHADSIASPAPKGVGPLPHFPFFTHPRKPPLFSREASALFFGANFILLHEHLIRQILFEFGVRPADSYTSFEPLYRISENSKRNFISI
jgi:hypothetical protein